MDNETEEGGIRVGQVDSLHRGAFGEVGKGGDTLRPLDGGSGREVGSESSELGRGGAGGTEANKHGLGTAVAVQTGLTAEVFRRRCRRGSVSLGLGEALLDEVAEGGLVNAGADNSDIAFGEGGFGESLDVLLGDVAVRGCEERGTKTVAESKLVSGVDGACCGVVVDGLGLSKNKRGDVFLELVAGELGGGDEGSEDVDEVGANSRKSSYFLLIQL